MRILSKLFIMAIIILLVVFSTVIIFTHSKDSLSNPINTTLSPTSVEKAPTGYVCYFDKGVCWCAPKNRPNNEEIFNYTQNECNALK